jgi:mitogen-activated protein kinase kinase kinase 4
MGKAVTVTNEQTSIHRDVSTKIHDLKVAACKLAGQLIKAANHIEEQLGTGESCEKTYMAAMDTCFNLGFEHVRDVFRLVGEELAYRELGATILEYSQLWIRFVMYKCEHRLGEKPRWTSLGLEFIILACAPRQLALMSRTNFLSLRQLMNLTLDYVNREAVVIEGKRSKFQASQYTLYDIHESEQYTDSLYGSQHRVYGAHTSDLHTAGLRHSLTPHLYSSLSYDTSENRSLSTPRRFSRSLSGGLALLSSGNEGDRLANIQKKIRLLELNREEQLCKSRIIGRVKSTQPSSHQPLKWQRGTKLGEGRFGKVYECRNLDTGEMMAVKQMSVQEKDSGTLQTICDEIGIFQKVSHENIVQFHGLKVYHTELYVFMEYCHEGTLWTKAQQGLPEHMIRRYTRDLLRAVDMLHDRGIIHRDIKGSNIFLSKHSIKLGDCGLSVYLKKKTIQQQVGTIPYLSPEVVLEQEMGKPLDIWNVGCVVVEMATRKLPWSECDNQLKIVFQIGTGKSPPISRSALCDEGHEFLSHCFQASPNERWRALELLSHPFVKVSDV